MNYFSQFENEVIWVLEHKEERHSYNIPIRAILMEFTTWPASTSHHFRGSMGSDPVKTQSWQPQWRSHCVHSNMLQREVFLHLLSSHPGTAGDTDQLCMTDPVYVTTILTPHYKPCFPCKEHLLSEWHVFNVLIYHCQIQDFYCWNLNIVFKALLWLQMFYI